MNMKKNSFAIFALALLSTMIGSLTFTTPILAQNTNAGNDNTNFSEFLECLLDDDGNGTVSTQEIEGVLNEQGSAPTEQEIRDCFAPIYNSGTGTSDADDNGNDSVNSDNNSNDNGNTDNADDEDNSVDNNSGANN